MPDPLCRDSTRRYIIIPDTEVEGCAVLRAQATLDLSTQEAGLKIAQPSVSTAPAGDIRPTLGGELELEVAGQIVVTKPGVVEDARYGWVRDGDDTSTDLQLRQSPHVAGKRFDSIIHHDAPSIRRPVRPKLLPLASGDLLCVWIERDWSPVYGRDATTISTVTEAVTFSVLDHSTDTWSTPAAGPVPLGADAGAEFTGGLDAVQFLDTSEILLFYLVNQSNTAGSADPRKLLTYVSVDDGATWIQRSRNHFDGAVPDIVFDPADDSPFVGLAAELLPSGRVVLFALTENNSWSITSDDRGATWGILQVENHGADLEAAGHGVGSTLCRNGVAAFSRSLRNGVSDPWRVEVFLTADGVSFSGPTVIAASISTVDAAICVSPDGWPHVYGSAHRVVDPNGSVFSYRDWLWGRRLKTRDPVLGDSFEDLIPVTSSGAARKNMAFHTHEGAPAGSYTTEAIQYHGFTSLDAVTYRGQVVLVSAVQVDDTATEGQPQLLESGLAVFRLNHWQPIQERLGQAHPSTNAWTPGYPAGGYIYNRTWDCYGPPGSWGFTPAGAGAESMVYGGAEGGYLQISSPDGKTYADGSLPSADTGKEGVLRVVCQARAGGLATSDHIAIRLFLSTGSSAAGLVIRLERTLTGTNIHLINFQTQVNHGTLLVPNDLWIEILVVVQAGSGWNASVYARTYARAEDPDWEAPYDLVGTNSAGTDTAVADGLAFGHFVDGVVATSWWKSVHLSRVAETGVAALTQKGITYIDEDSAADTTVSGTGEPRLDSGLDNIMRSAIAANNPPHFVSRGSSLSWAGEATTRGRYGYSSAYSFPRSAILALPPRKEWRSANSDAQIEIVIDADPDGTGARFRPTGLAVFGRNWPSAFFQLNSADSWSSPAVECSFGYPNDSTSPDRYTNLWSLDPAGLFVYHVKDKRLTVYPQSGFWLGVGPWVPGRFRSNSQGPKYYAVFRRTSPLLQHVHRIIDNTADTLTFETAPDPAIFESGGVWGWPFTIFSDRFAALIDWKYPATFTPSTPPGLLPNSHVLGYRYLRILLPQVQHQDADEEFYRLGYLLIGTALEVSGPDVNWGWGKEISSGVEVTYSDAGIASSRAKHQPRRSVRFDYSYLRPPPEMASEVDSPTFAPRKTWGHWAAVVNRLQVDGVPAALLWEGDRAVGASSDPAPEPVVSDPNDMMLARLTSPGSIEHVLYEHDTLNLGAGDTSLPRPGAVVNGIVFTEEL